MKNYNKQYYDSLSEGEYVLGAPHLKHKSIATLYIDLLQSAFATVSNSKSGMLRVLDIGAGDGSATIPLLMRGASVLAVDISEQQLAQLRSKCKDLPGHLEVRCADINMVLNEDRYYDIVVANSLLHHIPDYIDLVKRASSRLSDNGILFCFQDPMWNPSISRRDALVTWVVYTGWRLKQGDVLAGIWRRFRRILGIYSADSIHDNTEYHAVRNGVNQNEIVSTLSREGFSCLLKEYCSFQSDFWQPVGEKWGVKNTFALICSKQVKDNDSP